VYSVSGRAQNKTGRCVQEESGDEATAALGTWRGRNSQGKSPRLQAGTGTTQAQGAPATRDIPPVCLARRPGSEANSGRRTAGSVHASFRRRWSPSAVACGQRACGFLRVGPRSQQMAAPRGEWCLLRACHVGTTSGFSDFTRLDWMERSRPNPDQLRGLASLTLTRFVSCNRISISHEKTHTPGATPAPTRPTHTPLLVLCTAPARQIPAQLSSQRGREQTKANHNIYYSSAKPNRSPPETWQRAETKNNLQLP
jgi:hypothetical protein